MPNATKLSLTGAQVLVVDDVPANVEVLYRVLEEDSYQISVAHSGERACKIAAHILPDLILLDVGMPGMDGYETCRHLKKAAATRDIPVIFITARNQVRDVVEGFATGAVDYISKPFHKDEVCARVRTHLRMRFLDKERENLIEELSILNKVHRDQAQYLRSVLNNVGDGVITINDQCAVETINPAACLLFGYDEDEVIGISFSLLLAPPDDADYQRYLAAYSRRSSAPFPIGCGPCEVMGKRKDGVCFPFELSLSEMYVNQHIFVAVLHDISLHKRVEHELRRLSGLDADTNIANQQRYNECLQREWWRAQSEGTALAILVIEVDDLAVYKQTHHHAAVNEALKRMARIIDGVARHPCDLAARFDGDIFMVLLSGLEEPVVCAMAEEIRSDIEALGLPTAGQGVLTVSLGGALMKPDINDTIETLREAAKQQKEQAQQAGYNQVAVITLHGATHPPALKGEGG